MNLLRDRWIPIRRASGRREHIAPHEVTDRIDEDPVVALDAPRPDFNGALIQFLIGLVQTAWVHAKKDWDRGDMLWAPPDPQALASLFEPLKEAFELDGDGPRFMQDLTLSAADAPSETKIAALLIDFPGAQSIENNTDHFVKGDSGGALCPQCAATALLCLMTNAPSGGAGHRTSIRGGGPLTTLVAYTQTDLSQPRPALWRDVSSNVIDSNAFGTTHSQDATLSPIFPWLRSIVETLNQAGEVQPMDVHPLQIYWATPRRIRLQFVREAPALCALCDRQCSVSATHYFTKNYGLNYKGPWRHPLSPYYRNKTTDAFLPVHPQSDGLAYRQWLGWALGSKRSGKEIVAAEAVRAFHSARVQPGQMRLWAFGYDMDNMKARCWYETTFPLFDLSNAVDSLAESSETIVAVVDPLIAAAESVAQYLRFAVRDAWFGNGETRGNLGFVDGQFWNRTEREFYATVERAIALCREHGRSAYDQSEPLRRGWLDTLRRAALQLFDEIAASGSVEAGNPVKLAAAQRTLHSQLFGDHLITTVGLLAANPPASGGKRRSTARKSSRASLEAR